MKELTKKEIIDLIAKLEMAISYKESLCCIRELIGTMRIGTEYTHKQYHEVFNNINKLLFGVGL